jgi:competence protein ComEA
VTRSILACSAALAAVVLGGVGSMVAAGGAACPPAAQVVPRHRVDIDRAGADEIAMLADVGPSLAARIVADRAARGPFASVDDLRRVRGVGQATLDGIREDIRTEPNSRGHR